MKAVHTPSEPLAAVIEREIPPGTSRSEVEKRLASLGIQTQVAYLPAGGAHDPNFPGAYGEIETYVDRIGSKN